MKWVHFVVFILATAIVAANIIEDFPVTLYNAVAANSTDDNIAISPAGVQSMLALLSLGAKGETASLLNSKLEWPIGSGSLDANLRKALIQARSGLKPKVEDWVAQTFESERKMKDLSKLIDTLAKETNAKLRSLKKDGLVKKFTGFFKKKVGEFLDKVYPTQVKPEQAKGGDQKKNVAEQFGRTFEKNGLFKVAIGVFVSDNLEIVAPFKDMATKSFGARVKSINFRNPDAAKEINSFVDERRYGKTKPFVEPSALGPDTQVVVVNRLTVKASFAYPFDNRATRQEVFTDKDGNRVLANMMYQENKFLYAELPFWKARAVEIPFDKTDIRLLILLPNEPTGLAELQRSIRVATNLRAIHESMKNETVLLLLPQFRITTNLCLQPAFEKMDLGSIYTSKSDFKALATGAQELSITHVLQKVVISITEAGTQPYASYGLRKLKTTFNTKPIEFEATHPFMYAIKDDNEVYLVGHVTKRYF